MDQHKTYRPSEGYTRIIERGEMRMDSLDFGILSLSGGGSFFEDTADNEVVLIVLGGRCELLVGHNANKAHGFIGERPNVFAGEAHRAYIPYRTTYEVIAYEGPVEIAICKAPSFLETAAVILAPGEDFNDNAHEFIVSEQPIPSVSGEAIGFYRFDPAEGDAHQHVYNNDRSLDQSVCVRHNDVLVLPKGYHAELVESSARLYCLWMVSRENLS
ncbi:MAG: 5-deoxy-glucuronate isomerase [Candidatus Poribacteria bacterium]|nr:5-deoxy-glucuronate isomerase [Candidatus Poribacteria bacterium]